MQGGFGVMELLICSVVLAILSVAVAVGVILIVRFVQRARNKEG
jgi:type II secretory pathway pseudopilin PulG